MDITLDNEIRLEGAEFPTTTFLRGEHESLK